MLKVFAVLFGVAVLAYSNAAGAADEKKPAPYVGKVMMETIVFFPKEFQQLDEKVKAELKEQMIKTTGAQEREDGLHLPVRPLIGAWLKTGKQTIMIDTNGDFAIRSLPPNITEIPIYQQLSDRVPMAQFPVKRLSNKGEKVEPFVISIRAPFGECHGGKVDHTN